MAARTSIRKVTDGNLLKNSFWTNSYGPQKSCDVKRFLTGEAIASIPEALAPMIHQPLTFDNAMEVFGHRTTRELIRSYFVLHACAVDPLVSRSYELMKIGEKVLGPFFLSKLISPFYFQFVAGNSEPQMNKVAHTLSSVGINLMVAPMLETDVGDSDNSGDVLFENNFKKTLHLIDISSRCELTSNSLRPICQTKITAHIKADSLVNISKIYEKLNDEERQSLVKSLCNFMQSYMRSGDARLDSNLQKLDLSRADMIALTLCLQRLSAIGETCKEKHVILAVDAEYSYTNAAISLLTLSLMAAFNDGAPVIWNTYQGYLKSTRYWLEHDIKLAQSAGVSFGAKVVRGAYMEKEREIATLTNSPDPVNETYEITNKTYDSLVEYLLPRIVSSPLQFQMMAATHNEASVLNLVRKMKTLQLQNATSSVLFGQIYGMAENISVPLSRGGYSIYKSVPYGDVIEVLPYLSRRANENRAVFHGARRERKLLAEELRRRLTTSLGVYNIFKNSNAIV